MEQIFDDDKCDCEHTEVASASFQVCCEVHDE
jgi:hypothetical protein